MSIKFIKLFKNTRKFDKKVIMAIQKYQKFLSVSFIIIFKVIEMNKTKMKKLQNKKLL